MLSSRREGSTHLSLAIASVWHQFIIVYARWSNLNSRWPAVLWPVLLILLDVRLMKFILLLFFFRKDRKSPFDALQRSGKYLILHLKQKHLVIVFYLLPTYLLHHVQRNGGDWAVEHLRGTGVWIEEMKELRDLTLLKFNSKRVKRGPQSEEQTQIELH